MIGIHLVEFINTHLVGIVAQRTQWTIGHSRLLASVIVPAGNAPLGFYSPVGLHLLGIVIAGRVAKSIGDGADKLIGIVAVCTLRTTGITDGAVALLWEIGDPTLLVTVGSACMDAASLLVVFPTERVPVTVGLLHHTVILVADSCRLPQSIGNAYHVALSVIGIANKLLVLHKNCSSKKCSSDGILNTILTASTLSFSMY